MYVVKQPPIRRSFGMMELIDHHYVKVIRHDAGKPCFRKGLDACEYMTPVCGLLSVDEQLAKSRISEDFLIHPPCLKKYHHGKPFCVIISIVEGVTIEATSAAIGVS